MKKWSFFIGIALISMACGNPTPENQTAEQPAEEVAEENTQAEEAGVTFPYQAGAEFDAEKAITPAELRTQMESFEGDSMKVTLAAGINACCKKKGCWMTLNMGEGDDMRVRFKDYEFFVPLNSDGRQTVVEGVVFRDTITVAQLRHFAEDAGASADSIEQITEPEVSLEFLASGVIVQ